MEYESEIPYELIVAMTPEGAIGITDDETGVQKIPWNLPEDMRIFREKTANSIVVMGRKTFDKLTESSGSELLDRTSNGVIHVVVTRTPSLYTPEYINTDSVFFAKLEDVDDMVQMLLDTYPKSANPRVFICGGADIYRVFLNRCISLHITLVHTKIEGPTVTVLDFATMMDIKERFIEIEGTGRLISSNVERIEYEHRVLKTEVDT